MNIHLKKGHDLKLAGKPTKQLNNIQPDTVVKLHPVEFPGLKPKLLVKEGDAVKKGSPIFFDKNHPKIMFTSPAGGRVENIVFGERRRIEIVEIAVDDNAGEMTFDSFTPDELSGLTGEKIISILCTSGLWPTIRRRPFSKIAEPDKSPKSIFISTMSTAPFAADVEIILENTTEEKIQAGIDVLQSLTNGAVNLVSPKNDSNSKLTDLFNVQHHTYSGPHPSGNVGVHVSHIDPIKNKDDSIWYISLQDVISIGTLFLTGKVDYRKIIMVAGSAVSEKQHYSINRGTLISQILNNNNLDTGARIISGDVLTGSISNMDNAIGFYHEAITVIPNVPDRVFMGWISPGFSKYSLSNTFLSKILPKREQVLTSSMNGSKRAILPIGAIEKVMPLNILPTMLVKSIIANDIENMEQLGIYECDAEDFALCSFSDASKMDITGIIQNGLDFAEAEG
ncbi:MAG: Na(+)-translocating NADH-quinone reductase subunit A [Candidatus Marinimicrobia bacterium]|nr:Na(+)-translocating NADH-quinone reductase subunit A [Candidatus Neomarinimicrobiota bacterium]